VRAQGLQAQTGERAPAYRGKVTEGRFRAYRHRRVRRAKREGAGLQAQKGERPQA